MPVNDTIEERTAFAFGINDMPEAFRKEICNHLTTNNREEIIELLSKFRENHRKYNPGSHYPTVAYKPYLSKQINDARSCYICWLWFDDFDDMVPLRVECPVHHAHRACLGKVLRDPTKALRYCNS
jgi:hypothetical protein